MNKLSVKAFSALRWGYFGYIVRAISSMSVGVVLARILGPKPFGQVAAVMLVIGLANLLADGGFGSAIIQSKDLDEDDVRFSFTCQVALGCILTTVCMLIAHSAAIFLKDLGIESVLRATAVVFIVQALGQTSTALLKRRFNFRAVQIAQLVSYIFGYAVVGITLACIGGGVWSLVAAQLSASALYTIVVMSVARHCVIPGWGTPRWRIAQFGLKVMGSNIVNYGISNLDNTIVGHTYGSMSLGLYSRAFNTVSAPSDAFVNNLQQVLFASCSRYQDNKESIAKIYLASIGLMSLILFPVFWAVCAAAPTVIAVMYGDRWSGAVPLLRPLAIAITINAVMALTGPVLAARNEVKRELITQMQTLMIGIPVFVICCRSSVVVMAWGVVGVYLFRAWAVVRQGLKVMGIGWGKLFTELRGGITIGLTVIVNILTIERVISPAVKQVSILLIVCGLSWLIALTIFAVLPHYVISKNVAKVIQSSNIDLPLFIQRRIQVVVDGANPVYSEPK